jgi:hypothetical protein
VSLIKHDEEEDWAILKRQDEDIFLKVASICMEDDKLPDDQGDSVDISVKFFNAGFFTKKLVCTSKKSRFIQFQDSDSLPSSYGECEVMIADGSSSGVCGAPYFLPGTNEAFAFHIASDNEAMKYDPKEIQACVRSQSETYTHFSIGRVFCRLKIFMKAYEELKAPTSYSSSSVHSQIGDNDELKVATESSSS